MTKARFIIFDETFDQKGFHSFSPIWQGSIVFVTIHIIHPRATVIARRENGSFRNRAKPGGSIAFI